MSEGRGLRRSPTVLARWVGDRVILARSDGDGFEMLDGPGAVVWELLEEGVTQTRITDALTAWFGAPRDVIVRDVARLLEDLRERGLVERVEGGRV